MKKLQTIVKNYVIFNAQTFFDQPVRNDLVTHNNVHKL